MRLRLVACGVLPERWKGTEMVERAMRGRGKGDLMIINPCDMG